MNIFRIYVYKSIILLIILSIVLNILRIIIWDKFSLIYILWNIFLAFIPFVISSFMVLLLKEEKLKKFTLIFLGSLWLLFIPNAPYVITDFVHLGVVRAVPILYDTLLLFTSALIGLIFGLISINHIEQIISLKFSKNITSIFIYLLIFIISFGVYLGRFLRFNSWDIFARPGNVFNGLKEIFTNITNLTEALLFTTLFFIFILIFYFLSKEIKIK